MLAVDWARDAWTDHCKVAGVPVEGVTGKGRTQSEELPRQEARNPEQRRFSSKNDSPCFED